MLEPFPQTSLDGIDNTIGSTQTEISLFVFKEQTRNNVQGVIEKASLMIGPRL